MQATSVDPSKQRVLRERIQRELVASLGAGAGVGDSDLLQRQIAVLLDRVAGEEGVALSRRDRDALLQSVVHAVTGLGPIEPLVRDPTITEIMVNGPDRVFVERDGRIQRTAITFDNDQHVKLIIDRIIGPLGRRCDEGTPYVDARLKDGSRVHAAIPPLAVEGPVLNIRKFAAVPLKPDDLVRDGSVSREAMDFLQLCVRSRLNIVISGGTGTGKTTMLNVLAAFIPPDERLISCEDTAELRLFHDDWVALETRTPNPDGRGAITMRDLVTNSLRMRPDRILVGECRGAEALDMVQAMNTGHEGSLTTVHANSPADALNRLEVMCLMAEMDLPLAAVRRQIVAAVHLVVHLQRFSDGSRRITHVTQVSGIQGDEVAAEDIFRFTQSGMDPATKRVLGSLEATGARPSMRGARELPEAGLDRFFGPPPQDQSSQTPPPPPQFLHPQPSPPQPLHQAPPQTPRPAVVPPPYGLPGVLSVFPSEPAQATEARRLPVQPASLEHEGPGNDQVRRIGAVLFTDNGRITGEFHTTQWRLSDALNVIGDPYVQIHDAALQSFVPARDGDVGLAVAIIRRDAVLFALPRQAGAGVELPPGRSGLRLPRDPLRVTIKLWPFSIEGIVHLPPGADLAEFVHAPQRPFCPVTEATVSYQPSPLMDFQAPFLLLNWAHVEAVLDTSKMGLRDVLDTDIAPAVPPPLELSPARAAELLIATGLFKPMDVGPLQEVCAAQIATSRMTRRLVPAGAEVFRQADEGDTLYIVENGTLEAWLRDRPADQERRLAGFGPGDFFGEMAVLGDGHRTATVRTVSESSLLAVHLVAVQALLKVLPGASTRLLNVMLQRQAGLERLPVADRDRPVA